jgi:hypothetical protein
LLAQFRTAITILLTQFRTAITVLLTQFRTAITVLLTQFRTAITILLTQFRVGFLFREKNDEYYRFFLVKEQKEIFICSVCSMCLTTEEKIKVS